VGLTQDGREVANFSLATNTTWKDPTGEWQTCTEWHRISVFREPTVRWLKDVFQKGISLYVEGKLSYHHGIDKYGQPRLTAHIVVSNWDGRVHHLGSSTKRRARTSLEEDASGRSESIVPALEAPREGALSTQPCPQTTNPEDSSQQENN